MRQWAQRLVRQWAVRALTSAVAAKTALVVGAVAVVAALLFGVFFLLVAASESEADTKSGGLSGVACATAGAAVTEQGLTAEQRGHASTIIRVGRQMGIPVRGHIVAIATALQESGLRNLSHGDRDSLGLFQQRPSQGWGTRAQIMTPAYASKTFYEHLVRVRGWESMSVAGAAQSVQHSAFPDAYARHEQHAAEIVASTAQVEDGHRVVPASTGSGCTPQGSAGTAVTVGWVRVALAQVGKPYVWGATGPDSFDCSGLIVYALRQSGYGLGVRTSQQMHSVSLPVPSGKERTGDLVFSEFQAGGPAHVMVVVRPGLLVEAPRTGLNVRTRAYDAQKEGLAFGRLPDSQLRPVGA
ncbi:C40 family peptidase [Streptomyces sp. NPDC001255]|uniref:C40 family peptidase n=1 Tax=Streptomyces sp. NPDC001255 TaxID=3364550 RepID=UPI0036C2C42C